jgi:hypothetical protein
MRLRNWKHMSKIGLTKNYGTSGAKDLLTNCNRVKFTLKYFTGFDNTPFDTSWV